VTGGDWIEGTLTLVRPAVANGVTIRMASSNISVAATPNVIFDAGEASRRFRIRTVVVTQDQPVTFSATAGGDTATTVLLVRPPRLSRIALTASEAEGGDTIPGTLTFTGAPSAIGMSAAQVRSDNPAVYAPSFSVSVPNGASVAPFRVIARPVTQVTTVKISGSFAGETVATQLTLRPPVLVSGNVCNTNCYDSWQLPASLDVHVVLSSPAAAGGVAVKITHTAPPAVQIPSAAIVPAGQRSLRVPFLVPWGTVPFTATVSTSSTNQVVSDGFSVVLPDLSFPGGFQLFDKFGNAITKPPALEAFAACVTWITHTNGSLHVTMPLPPYTVLFDYKLSDGPGRTGRVTPTGSYQLPRACFQMSGVEQGEHFDLEAFLDDANVITEKSETNNKLKKRFAPD
jgi:hypothetical protein